MHGKKTYGASSLWSGVQFHFHHRSEHTVEGKHHDLEMHTVNYPTEKNADGSNKNENGFIAAAMGLMFSVNDYTREMEGWEQEILDNFFENLNWEDKITEDTTDSHFVDLASYGDLMTMVDMNNRWTYRGSVTTPPCAQNVYWNVLRTVYPIKQETLNKFQMQLSRAKAPHTICALNEDGSTPHHCLPGNNREVMPLYPDHNPFIISSGEDLTNSVRSTNQGYGATNTNSMLQLQNTVNSLKSSAGSPAATVGEDSSSLTTVITVLLIIAILFLLLAVVIVTKNSFNKPVVYQGVETGTLATERAN